MDFEALAADLRNWARELQFDDARIAELEFGEHLPRMQRWLDAGYHGEMAYLVAHARVKRDPTLLLPGALRAIVVRMNYRSDGVDPLAVLGDPTRAYIARYALGADYHKLMRRRLARLADRINAAAGPAGFRACVDSAPVLEKALAERAGIGWFGKHTLILHRDGGSFFCLGVLLTDLPLPADRQPARDLCGACVRCMEVCPTGAIIGARLLDARRCISYLTIEHRGSIPESLRRAIGNRVFGCDDCQVFCPRNRQTPATEVARFAPRHGLDDASLLELFGWDEATFLARSEGMALRRISFVQWQRNLAVALGNAPPGNDVIAALEACMADPLTDPLVREHVGWALARQRGA